MRARLISLRRDFPSRSVPKHGSHPIDGARRPHSSPDPRFRTAKPKTKTAAAWSTPQQELNKINDKYG